MKKIFSFIIIMLFFTTLIPSSVFSNKLIENPSNKDILFYDYETYFKDHIIIRINITNETVDIPKNFNVIAECSGKYIDVSLKNYEFSEFIDYGYDYTILNEDLFNLNFKVAKDYHTFSQMEGILENISFNNPDITRLYSIGLSYENRNFWCLEITDNPGVDEDEPGVLFMGVHHAREWPTMEICLNIADELTSKYNIDSNFTDIINSRRIWIIPCVNPDGYYYDHDLNNGETWWRKNRHFFPEFGTYGVDLNRNYGGSVNGDDLGMWGSIGISSVTHSYDNNLFCGLNSMSELEVKAICDFYIENDICASISWHTSGELVLWPWAYSTDISTPDDEYLSHIGNEIAIRIKKQDGYSTYVPYQAANLYPTTGDTDDWAYGYGHYILGKPIFAYTIEACESFHPNSDVLEQVCSENFNGAFYLLHEAENISKIIPRVIPPKNINIDYSGYYNFTINWDEVNPTANPNFFQLDELSNLSLITEDCEKNSNLWNINGFLQTDNRHHSGNYSYRSHSSRNKVSSMTSKYPIPITNKSSLSFWCWYDIDRYDMAFIEVSLDGRDFKIIDKFNSSSDGWIFKNYDLQEYKGMSIFIRFRYTTDSNNNGLGFFVDDILPIAYFDDIKIISNSISDNYYKIKNKADGIYYYQIRGYNNEHGWGDYSILKRADIGFDYNEPPTTPNINGINFGEVKTEYQFSFISHDPEDGGIYYYIDWGDGKKEDWIGPYPSGVEIILNHSWNRKGNFTIRVKVKDDYNLESDWGSFQLSMPKRYKINKIFMIDFLNFLINKISFFK